MIELWTFDRNSCNCLTFAAIDHGRSIRGLYKKGATSSDLVLWFEGVLWLQSIKDFRHNMGTLSCCNGVSTNGLKIWKIVANTSVTHEEGVGRLCATTNDDNIERTCDMVLLNRRLTIDKLTQRLQIIHGSDYEIIHIIFWCKPLMKLSATKGRRMEELDHIFIARPQ